MKKFLTLTLALVSVVLSAPAQNSYTMRVTATDGTVTSFDVDNVARITYDRWVSLGMCEYTDDFIGSQWYISEPGDLCFTYEVEIQESVACPGLFRLVNPYGAAYPYNRPGDYDPDTNTYIEINACDPDGVYIDAQYTGCDWGNGDGEFIVWSWAAFEMQEEGWSLSRCKSSGYCGTYADGVITFPAYMLLFSASNLGGAFYFANIHSAFRVVMPSARSAAPVARAAAPAPGARQTLHSTAQEIDKR